MSLRQLPKAQVQILRALRRNPGARYSQMMRPTGLESDVFKFHVRNLTRSGLIQKQPEGEYCLSAAGKELANNLDESQQTVQKQPKLSLLVIVSRKNEAGETTYLLQQRLRNPYWGYWSLIGGPILWGESAEEAASRELAKQTGLQASLTVRSFYRKRDYDQISDELLEDKLFTILTAENVRGALQDTWSGGFNQWMTLKDLQNTEHYFDSTASIIMLAASGAAYGCEDAVYTSEDY